VRVDDRELCRWLADPAGGAELPSPTVVLELMVDRPPTIRRAGQTATIAMTRRPRSMFGPCGGRVGTAVGNPRTNPSS
jgi:hypothetical protein